MNNINIKQLENRLINSPQLNKNKINIERKGFGQVLEKIQNNEHNIKFTKHAIERMDNRDMVLNSEEMIKLETAFYKAEDKGVKDALILVGDKAFIASIKNKTIITTLNKEKLIDNVFTNIDGAVIV